MHIEYMERALELAKKSEGFTKPNPLVGAVIVKNGRIIGEGYHQKYGENHAEINAFNSATENVSGAVMYVTLEPCSHYGKTPPCANAIVKKGIKKVVIGMMDPNPVVSGKGIEILKSNGIEVEVGVLEDKIKKLNEIFIKYITTQIPFCILKAAMTLDGKIASYSGDSKWISNELSRRYVHRLRHRVSGIMVGINTIINDDPLLTTRLDDTDGIDPIRIVVDSKGRIPLSAKVLHGNSKAKTIIAATEFIDKDKIKAIQETGAEIILTPPKDDKVDLCYLMKELGKRKIDSVLLEGGGTLNFAALREGIVDKVNFFIAPKILGGREAKTPVGGQGIGLVRDAIILKDMEIYRFGEDIMIEGYIL
ncbi:bifunctional diaminohydroxyphosphoribosylaminopyrimidine deaminase/5-amino-6-(5-phosphoribosylamino)uracil reductase RibD [Fonticella tunisiensis]|uniref:Riboflavin biosynthesis protein RibD n=1 Tax=Fonticella tunisiensis TaxID=1096341 RepID=A0A4R7KTC0_9CLOT|nr:bifunctional diaminohydroxyphosphoribosylaminopyrimidine deaminase/5-amino-6-(5-phosphoribosylamino)uracil reductase RibD [Fonticella tunisiensis]TDT61352.1 diaminohydroxyphosphoribosylaminopyrimidine deaminase [Fonticella tunisiensis]